MPEPIEELPGEIWKPVVGWEDCYAVSSCGRVRSEARTVAHNVPGHTKSVRARILRYHAVGRGHQGVTLYRDGTKRHCLVHRLVLEAFTGPCPDGMECCHNDGNPANNRLENLRWDTHSSNVLDSVRHGTHAGGAQLGNTNRATITANDARSIKRALEAGMTPVQVHRWCGVAHHIVKQIARGKAWRWA